MTITIINYGLGNLGSIKNMLKAIDIDAVVSENNQDIVNASALILPGVGHFGHGMVNLAEHRVIDVLHKEIIERKKPLLGICLGAQLLMDESEEGEKKGLGWIKGNVKHFTDRYGKNGRPLKVPHMGWSSVTPNKTDLFDHMDEDRRYYFVHSYHLCPENEENILVRSYYGGEFVSGVKKENITGVQFHPEKSHQYGMIFFRNYFESLKGD